MIDEPKPSGNINQLGIPGGQIGFPDMPSQFDPIITRWRLLLNGNDWGFPCLRDPDFVENFTRSVNSSDEQDKYVLNTSAYLSGLDKSKYDSHYVLVFRRSLPTDKPKPEQHWTTDYITAVRGLGQEVQGVHRLHSMILCSTLEELNRIGLDENQDVKAVSDGEIKIKPIPFDQNNCVTKFRPKNQQEELDTYMKTKDAITLETLLNQLSDANK